MSQILSVETWFVISVLLAPIGYVVQDVVADAMTVEAVPTFDEMGKAYSPESIKIMHTTMQTLGRFAIIGGTVLVAIANIIIFKNIESVKEIDQNIFIWVRLFIRFNYSIYFYFRCGTCFLSKI